MPKGPHLNNITKNFTTRDSLGIEGVAASIAADICPIVNTVTPRAFYWIFMVWLYYDYHKYSGVSEKTVESFNNYLKRQDYFFVLANLLNPDSDQDYMVGKTRTLDNIKSNPDGPYTYDPLYFKARYGGMQYFNAGCFTMRLVTDVNPHNPNEMYSFPKLTTDGEKLALAFEKVIKNTEYYKKYRLQDVSVPRDVLIEYGKVINIGLIGFDECKDIFKHSLFANQPKLVECADYLKNLWKNHNYTELDEEKCRKAFFDHLDDNDNDICVDENLEAIARGWEIVAGRQYFTAGMEMIWKYMLDLIESPLTEKQWLESAIVNSKWTFGLEDNLKDILKNCVFDFNTRENMISDARRNRNSLSSIENGLKIVLSIYNRFYDRQDMGEEEALFHYDNDGNSISFTDLFNIVNDYKDRPIKDFIIYIMDNWLIKQHYLTAFDKMMQERDGFFYEIIDGMYLKKYDFSIDFQGIRLRMLSNVMMDLNML